MSKPHFSSTQHTDGGSGVVVSKLAGHLDGQSECFQWLDQLRSDVQAGNSRIVVNLENVDRVDSTGLGILASAHVSATRAGGKVCLTGLNDRLRLLFDTTWLFKVIPTAGSEAEAVRACAHPG
jgi:anti-sigma B factor antagonist